MRKGGVERGGCKKEENGLTHSHPPLTIKHTEHSPAHRRCRNQDSGTTTRSTHPLLVVLLAGNDARASAVAAADVADVAAVAAVAAVDVAAVAN